MTLDTKRLRELCTIAIDGPWSIVDADHRDSIRILDGNGMYVCTVDDDPGSAQFIAAARTAVPELLAEVERLRGKLDDVTNGDFEAWCDKFMAPRVANAQHAYDRVVAARDNARANARILAHSYTHDSRPPQRVVDEALAYPARPEAPFDDDESRCAVCGWPLALPPSTAGTCLRGNCSMRPRPERLYAPKRAAKESK